MTDGARADVDRETDETAEVTDAETTDRPRAGDDVARDVPRSLQWR